MIIDHLRFVFTHFGIPDCCFSDGEPIYKSRELQEFCDELDIKKVFSSAMYSQSNGQVERAIGHVKNLIKRCNYSFEDLQLCILDYHNTPLDSHTPSPFQIVMNRSVKGRLPCLTSNLVTESDKRVYKCLTERQNKASKYYNRNASDKVRVYKPGDPVVYRSGKCDRQWKHANPELRSYTLVNAKGSLIDRNVGMLLPDTTGRDFLITNPGADADLPVCESRSGIIPTKPVKTDHARMLPPTVVASPATVPSVLAAVPSAPSVIPNQTTGQPSAFVPRRSARIAAKNSVK